MNSGIWLRIVPIVVCFALLVGCNAIKGIGKDIQESADGAHKFLNSGADRVSTDSSSAAHHQPRRY